MILLFYKIGKRMYKGACFLVLIVLLILLYYKHSVENFVQTKSSIDGETYKVHDDFVDHQVAADKMAQVNHKILTLLRHLIKKGKEKDPQIQNLLHRYDWQKMRENSPFNLEGSTSYMENKGQVFAFCLRNKKDEYFDDNTLMFVTLHELSHLMTDSWGHEKDFWVAFKYLLEEAKDAGIYVPIDYTNHPVDYCGLVIKDNPYFYKV
jgi:predicted metal-dependent hydrolase